MRSCVLLEVLTLIVIFTFTACDHRKVNVADEAQAGARLDMNQGAELGDSMLIEDADAGLGLNDTDLTDALMMVVDQETEETDQDFPSSSASFDTLGSWLDDRVISESINGYGLMVFDDQDSLLIERSSGQCSNRGPCPNGTPDYTVDLVTGVASSSKWVISTLVLAALEDEVNLGRLPNLVSGLDRPLLNRLGCDAPLPADVESITIRQLLSFTSGLLSNHPCVGGTDSPIECACKILFDSAERMVDEVSLESPRSVAHRPGTTYKYGETNLLVAVALIESQLGFSWIDYFNSRVVEPAQMGNAFFRNTMNPSGSLRASAREYAAFVKTIFHDFSGAGVILSAEAVAEQFANQMPEGVVKLFTPRQDLDYGLNTWRWCYLGVDANVLQDTEQIQVDPSCDVIHQTGHAGKGGFTPWIDLTHSRYGVFSIREDFVGDQADDYSQEVLELITLVRLYSGLALP